MIGYINYINGLFLGKEELIRQQSFLSSNLVSLINTYGQKGLFSLRDKYTVSFDGTTLSLDGPNDILGIDSSSQIIYFNKLKSLSLSEYIGTSVYITLSSSLTHNEEGLVSLSSTGVLTGVGTKFSEVLRGSYTKKGTKVFFPSVNKSYLVESITSNTVAKLIGPIEAEIIDSEWCVIGTFSPFSTLEVQNTFPYTYYSYTLGATESLPDEATTFVIGKISWNGSTPSFEFTQNKSSLLGFNNLSSAFDYVVDSDDKLKALRSNSQATNVLIKKGAYTYTSPDGNGIILHPNTKCVWAEGGSLIKLFSSVPALADSIGFGYLNPSLGDSYFYNINIENNAFISGYKNLDNLINCKVKYTAVRYGYGFKACNRVINGEAISTNAVGVGFATCNYLTACKVSGFALGYGSCTSVSRCHSESSTGYSICYASRSVNPSYLCADTSDGGFNSSLGDIPAPPITNYNRITFEVITGESNEAIVKATAQFNVASTITFEFSIINDLGKEEQGNIILISGQRVVTKTMIGLTSPNQIYSIQSVISDVASDSTYTYLINY